MHRHNTALRLLVSLLCATTCGACGDDDVGTAPIPTALVTLAPPLDWARVSQAQVDHAKALGVPPAFENEFGMRFVILPESRGQSLSVATASVDEAGGAGTEGRLLAGPVYVQMTEMTNAMYQATGSIVRTDEFEGAPLGEPNQPVVHVSWEEANAVAWWLTQKLSGSTYGTLGEVAYGIPSAASWEWVCNCGSARPSYVRTDLSNLQDVAVFGSSPQRAVLLDPRTRRELHGTARTGSLEPSPWGLYDMLGNAWEWCADRPVEVPLGSFRDASFIPPPPRFTGCAKGGSYLSRRGDFAATPSRCPVDELTELYGVRLFVVGRKVDR